MYSLSKIMFSFLLPKMILESEKTCQASLSPSSSPVSDKSRGSEGLIQRKLSPMEGDTLIPGSVGYQDLV